MPCLRTRHIVEIFAALFLLAVLTVSGLGRFKRAQSLSRIADIHTHVSEILHAQMLHQPRFAEAKESKFYHEYAAHNKVFKYPNLNHLTTPVAYLKDIPIHPFHAEIQEPFAAYETGEHLENFPWEAPFEARILGSSAWTIGPCMIEAESVQALEPYERTADSFQSGILMGEKMHYDPSNGIFSAGWVIADSEGRRSSGFRLIE